LFHAAPLAGFALVALGLVLTPGPNMAYLVSRAITQGRSAGFVSLGGVGLGFIVYLLLAAFGITAMLFAVPVAYGVLRAAGAAYLAWLAWKALRPGGSSPFELRALAPDSPRRLFAMGFLTNLLNPKAALLYLSLLPQFVEPSRGHVLAQTLLLGTVQISVSLIVNACIVASAGTVAQFLQGQPVWARAQRYLMGGVLGVLAARMALDSRR
jgi:threonine/homoserine/homoserine lactone efflux protein